MTPVISQHIAMMPSANHGEKAVIAGTRIRVEFIYHWFEVEGKSAQQIVKEYPHLTQADIHAAMAFYWDNEELIQAQIKRGKELEDEMRKLYPPKLPEARKRMGLDSDSLPS